MCDEVALAARASTRKVDGLMRALPAWLEPIKKLIEAREAGATLAELREQMLEWHPNTQALADALAENVEAGLRGGYGGGGSSKSVWLQSVRRGVGFTS